MVAVFQSPTFGSLFKERDDEDSARQYQAGLEELQGKWGAYLTIIKLAEEKAIIEAIYGKQELITDYTVNEIYTYLAIQQDRDDFSKRLHKLMTRK